MRTFRSNLGLLIIGFTLGLAFLQALAIWGMELRLPTNWLATEEIACPPCTAGWYGVYPVPVPKCEIAAPPVTGWETKELCIFHDGDKQCLPEKMQDHRLWFQQTLYD